MPERCSSVSLVTSNREKTVSQNYEYLLYYIYEYMCVRARARIFSQHVSAGIGHLNVVQNIRYTKRLYQSSKYIFYSVLPEYASPSGRAV